MRFPFESKLPNYVISWYQIQDKPRSDQRRFHGAHTARITTACGIRKQKRPAGEFPCRPYGGEAPPGQSNQFATRDAKKESLRRSLRSPSARTPHRRRDDGQTERRIIRRCRMRGPAVRVRNAKSPQGRSPRGPLPARRARFRRRGGVAPAREAKSALRERDALPSRSLSLQYSRRRRA